LESSTDLGPGAMWLAVPDQPVLLDTTLVVTNDAAAGVKFYRLHKP